MEAPYVVDSQRVQKDFEGKENPASSNEWGRAVQVVLESHFNCFGNTFRKRRPHRGFRCRIVPVRHDVIYAQANKVSRNNAKQLDPISTFLFLHADQVSAKLMFLSD
mmetsp:Transcript_2236/g.3154  ORF Transcript_2236/g.3154 Transcript_2236/m.3154 type:complete len:107 (+) Transcript_2236:654-974(+)